MDRSRVIRPSLCFAALGGGLVLSLALTGGPLAAQGVRPPKPAGPALLAAPTPPAAQGTVSALTGTSFTLTSPAGITDTVDFTSTTAVRSGPGPVGQAGGATATLADGDQVQVFGSTHGDTIAASAIVLAPSPPTPPASGAPTPPTPPAAQGTVSALTGTSFTLTSPAGITDNVDFTSTTAVRSGPRPIGQASGATATLTDGDQVQVFGSTHRDTIAASAIVLAPSPLTPPASGAPTPPTPPAARGTVSALTGTSFTLTSPAGITDTVDFTSTTAVRSGPGPVGQAGGATATLADGDQVQVFGSTHGNTIAASAILLAPSPPTPPAGPPAPAGATRP